MNLHKAAEHQGIHAEPDIGLSLHRGLLDLKPQQVGVLVSVQHLIDELKLLLINVGCVNSRDTAKGIRNMLLHGTPDYRVSDISGQRLFSFVKSRKSQVHH